MKKFLLYGYGGAYNHGAEAIVRTTVPILRKYGGQILLSTHFPEQDREFGVDKLVDKLIPAELSYVPQERAASTLEGKEALAQRMYRDALAEIDGDTVCIGIGGDNYCYPNWYRQSLFHKAAKERDAVSILWGCSIEPTGIDPRMEAVLKGHDHIYARESETYQALLAHGISQVMLLPDPAFSLTLSPIPLPEGFVPGGTVAVNLSPLMLRQRGETLDYFVETAHRLLERAKALLLLPHVTMAADDDRAALAALTERLMPDERQRVCCPDAHQNAAQLKYLISQCELLVCTRTHASIAGYSSCVPTLVLGYSVKSIGIGRDLHMEPWVLRLNECWKLPQLAVELWNDRQEIRRLLSERMGSYLESPMLKADFIWQRPNA